VNTLSVFDNPNLHLNPKLTDVLTDYPNRLGRILTKKEIEFIRRAYSINVLSGRPFSYYDYPQMKNGAYRQHIKNLRPIIEVVKATNPKQYKLKGLYTDEKLTERYTDLSQEQRQFQTLDILLSLVKHERVYMHDIRLEAKVSDLYENLIKNGFTPNSQNKMITIPVEVNSSFHTKVNVTRDSIIVIIGCTFSPVEYSRAGIISLSTHLGEVIYHLKGLSKVEFGYEPVFNWRFKYFHLNRDSIEHEFDKSFTLNTILGHTTIYKHDLPNGKSVIRLEDKLTPDTTLEQEMLTPRFKASEL
jgi:hypothetical protein